MHHMSLLTLIVTTDQAGNDGFSSLCILQIMNRLEEGIKKDLNRFYEELQKPAVGNTSNDSNSNNDHSQEDNSKDDYEANDEFSSALYQNTIDVKRNILKRMKEIVKDHMKLRVPNIDKDEKARAEFKTRNLFQTPSGVVSYIIYCYCVYYFCLVFLLHF